MAPIRLKSSHRSTTRSASTQHPGAPPTTLTSSFSSISPSERSPSLPEHVRLKLGVEGPIPVALPPFGLPRTSVPTRLGPTQLDSFVGVGVGSHHGGRTKRSQDDPVDRADHAL